MPTDLSSLDSEVTKNCSDIPEYPIHENLWTCTRQTPCGNQSCLTCVFTADSNSILCTMQNPCTKQTCFVCLSPTDSNYIQNLTTALNTTTSKATIVTKPASPINHWIHNLTCGIQDAILCNDLPELRALINFYTQKIMSQPDSLNLDRSALLLRGLIDLYTQKIMSKPSPTPSAPTVTHKDGVTIPSVSTVTHRVGVTTPSAPTVTHKNEVTTPSTPTVTHKYGVTTPLVPTVTHKDGATTLSAPTVTHKDGVTTPSAPTVTHENGVTTPSAPTVTHKDGVTTPSVPTVTHEDGVPNPSIPTTPARMELQLHQFLHSTSARHQLSPDSRNTLQHLISKYYPNPR